MKIIMTIKKQHGIVQMVCNNFDPLCNCDECIKRGIDEVFRNPEELINLK